MIGIFCLFPRCGSQSLMLGLSSFLGVDYVNEPLNPSNYWGGRLDITCNKNLIKNAKSKGYGVIKVMHEQMPLQDNLRLLRECDKTIFLYRRYYVDSFLSAHISMSYKHSNGKNLWHKVRDEDKKNLSHFFSFERPPVDIGLCKSTYYELVKAKYVYDNFDFTDIICYEDFYDNSVLDNFDKLCSNIDVSSKDESYKKFFDKDMKLNSNAKYKELIPNYDKIIGLRDELKF